jgi:hypothetical protein
MDGGMSDPPQRSVLGSLPRTRPHRRSDKRAGAPANPATAPAVSAQATASPKPRTATKPQATTKPGTATKPQATTKPGTATKPRAATKPKTAAAPLRRRAEPVAPPPQTHGALETAVQAAAELAEIGLHASARALRRVVSRLPRP